MNFDVDVLRLSNQFAVDYPCNKYPELMLKIGRPYTCLLIDTHQGYLICIPFRSSINHNNAFIFKHTSRSLKTRQGLDYSKVILIKNIDYLDSCSVIVDQDEYKEMIINIKTIVSQIVKYIDVYINHINGNKPLHEKQFQRKYKYSTLPYFHDILEIE